MSPGDDYVEICNLLYRYAELLNLGRFDEVGELFRDGVVRARGNPREYRGAEEVTAMYRESVIVPPGGGPDTLIYTTNVQLEIEGDVAKTRSYWVAVQSRHGKMEPVVGGRYHDVFRRANGRWQFSERTMLVDLMGDMGDHVARPIEEYLS